MNNRDDRLDACMHAIEFLSRKFTLWQRIKQWFHKLYIKIWIKFNRKKLSKAIRILAISPTFHQRNIMGNLYSEFINYKEVK